MFDIVSSVDIDISIRVKGEDKSDWFHTKYGDFYYIIDGHVSKYTVNHLNYLIYTEFNKIKKYKNIKLTKEFINKTINYIDKTIINKSIDESGAVAIITIINHIPNKIIVINIGDCWALYGNNITKDMNKTNKELCNKIKLKNKYINELFLNDRIFGILEPYSSFGEVHLKIKYPIKSWTLKRKRSFNDDKRWLSLKLSNNISKIKLNEEVINKYNNIDDEEYNKYKYIYFDKIEYPVIDVTPDIYIWDIDDEFKYICLSSDGFNKINNKILHELIYSKNNNFNKYRSKYNTDDSTMLIINIK